MDVPVKSPSWKKYGRRSLLDSVLDEPEVRENVPSESQTWGYRPRTLLSNEALGAYKRHGYGPDFPVLSRLKRAKNFKPDCWELSGVR